MGTMTLEFVYFITHLTSAYVCEGFGIDSFQYIIINCYLVYLLP